MSDRQGARRPASRTAASRGSSARPSAFIRGEQGRSRTDAELQRQKDKAERRRAQANKPFRFYVPVGETRQFIVCDDKPDFFLYEHALKDSEGRWGREFCGCIKEFANCPVCRSAERESYYAMALTIVDLTPFETRDGDTVEFSRKLLIVKPQQQKKFLRFHQKEGTLRGALFETTRDGDKDATIGNDIEFLEFVSEKEMATYVRTWKDREGKKHTEVCSDPYVYEEVFDEPTEESLLAIAGGEPVPGSRAANDRELGSRSSRPARGRASRDDDWDDADDNRGFGKDDDPPARGRRRSAESDDPPARPTRGRSREPEPEDDPPTRPARRGRAEPEDDAPVRGRARRAAEPEDDDAPTRGRPSRRVAEPEPEDDAPVRGSRRAAVTEEPEDDAPPPRRAARGRAAEPEDDTPRRGRAAPQEDEAPRRASRGRAEPDDDAPPRRGASRRAKPVDDDADDDIPF